MNKFISRIQAIWMLLKSKDAIVMTFSQGIDEFSTISVSDNEKVLTIEENLPKTLQRIRNLKRL